MELGLTASRHEYRLGHHRGLGAVRTHHLDRPSPRCACQPHDSAADKADAAGLEGREQRGADLGILLRHQATGDDRDLDPKCRPERGELAADDVAANDDHRRRQRLQPEGLVAGQIADVVQARQRRDQRAGAAGDDKPLRLVLLTGTVDSVRTEKPDRAFQQGDLLAGQTRTWASAGETLDDVARPADDPGVLQPPPVHLNPELAGVAHRLGDVRRAQQCLAGHATDMQTGSAQLPALGHRHPLAQPRRRAGRRIPRPTSANDQHLELLRHRYPLLQPHTACVLMISKSLKLSLFGRLERRLILHNAPPSPFTQVPLRRYPSPS